MGLDKEFDQEKYLKENDIYLNSYYHEFVPTGNVHIDRILHSIVRGIRLSHRVRDWNDSYESGIDEKSIFDEIQEAANNAAEVIKKEN